MSIENVATWIGTGVMTAGGLCITSLVLFLGAKGTLYFGLHLWKNLENIYRLESMRFWFKRMQENGTHVLRNECEDKLKAKQN